MELFNSSHSLFTHSSVSLHRSSFLSSSSILQNVGDPRPGGKRSYRKHAHHSTRRQGATGMGRCAELDESETTVWCTPVRSGRPADYAPQDTTYADGCRGCTKPQPRGC
jgi:hypothetical protein